MHARVFAAVAASFLAGAASADLYFFSADIGGANEVPPNGSPAVGFMIGTFDDGSNTLSFSWSITDDLVGEPSAPGAHFHHAPAGSNGPIVFGFRADDWELAGNDVWANMTAEQVGWLFDGEIYINFHTTAFPGGEVRGQVLLVPTQASMSLAVVGVLALAWRRR